MQVAGVPSASYDGGVPGFSATKPKDGKQFDKNAPAVQAYETHLAQTQQQVLNNVPGADKLYSYDTTFNGFAVKLTAAEATKMAKTNGVVNMWKNETHKADTMSTPDFLGLTGKNGVWEQQYGGDENAGSGVVVGIVDSGIWPENPSFAALPEPRPAGEEEAVYGTADEPGFTGICDQGADPDPANNITCNNKLIGARYFSEGIRASSTPPIDGEFESPRDWGGHGDHTASTAAGNHGVDAIIDGQNLGKISGMAPAARLAVYKACWETIDPDACATTADLVAAIDQAVTDGVDVINYSISGSSTYVVDPVELAFFNAAAAGVFVAASAGNSGPTASTVAHNSPWETTVAASTHDRDFGATATLGDGTKVTGAGRGAAVPSAPFVLSKDIAAPGASATDALLCAPGALDPAKAAGKIVGCQRGTVARTDKGLAVQQAGGIGMIMYNVPGGAADIAADLQVVPSIHLDATEGAKLLAYAASTAAPTAALAAGQQISKEAPAMADFSSAGPALTGGDLLKPDITAPGVDIIAAVAPPGNNGENYASYQGTSMSSPHIAGIAALIIGKHQDWSPAAVRSAMMTTASQTDNRGENIQRGGHDATPFDFGAGHVVPGRAFDPGLVYDSGPVDWVRYACGLGQWPLIQGGQEMCDEFGSIDPSDLNYPSIAIAQLAGKQTVTRTVTNVGSKTETYFATTEAADGMKIAVDKKTITLRPGQSATFKVTITRTTAALDAYNFGALTWRSVKGKTVRSPIVVKPVAMDAPREVTGTGTTGSLDMTLTPGYSGQLKAVQTALVADTVNTLPLSGPDGTSFDKNNPATSAHVGKVELSVPANAVLGRISTSNADFAQYGDGTDVDLYVYKKVGDKLQYLGASAQGGSDEVATLPAGADYVVFVDLYATPGGLPSLDVPVHTWAVGSVGAALTVNPASTAVTTGTPVKVTAGWSGLEAGKTYLAAVYYLNGDGKAVARTIVTVDA